MHRTVLRTVVVLSILVLGLAISDPGSASARATRTAVVGSALGAVGFGPDPLFDKAGGIHIRHLVIEWSNFSLSGSGVVIQGTLTSEFSGNLDEYGTGPVSGTFIVQTERDGVIWEGRSHGHLVEWMGTAVVTAQGRGPFSGKLLQLEMVEIPNLNPYQDDFALSGWILDLGR